ncbi:MAG: pyruvate dehydrogenase (acetyl-transferring), homodimeric type, partial [Aquiluna sp.]
MSINNQDAFAVNNPDRDPQETAEWLESLDALANKHGRGRAREIMLNLLRRSHELQLNVPLVPTTDYINTISPEDEPELTGDEQIERTYRAWMR